MTTPGGTRSEGAYARALGRIERRTWEIPSDEFGPGNELVVAAVKAAVNRIVSEEATAAQTELMEGSP